MNGPGSDPRNLDPRRSEQTPLYFSPATLKIVWIAFVAAIFVYLIVAYLVVGGSRGSGSLPSWLMPAAAALMALESLFVVPMLLRRSRPGTDPATASIVQWAVDEAVAVFGLVSVFTGAPPRALLGYALVSIALLVLHRPREER